MICTPLAFDHCSPSHLTNVLFMGIITFEWLVYRGCNWRFNNPSVTKPRKDRKASSIIAYVGAHEGVIYEMTNI